LVVHQCIDAFRAELLGFSLVARPQPMRNQGQ